MIHAMPRWLRFALVGCVNAGIDLGIFVVLHYVFAWTPLSAHVAGFSVAVVNSYVMNKLWTFEDRDWSTLAAMAALRFFGVAVGGLFVGAAVIALLVPPLPAIAAKLIAIGATFAWNYTLSKLWVFRA